MSREPTPPLSGDMSTGPIAESWCYTQVHAIKNAFLYVTYKLYSILRIL